MRPGAQLLAKVRTRPMKPGKGPTLKDALNNATDQEKTIRRHFRPRKTVFAQEPKLPDGDLDLALAGDLKPRQSPLMHSINSAKRAIELRVGVKTN